MDYFFAHVRVSRYGIQERVNYDSVPSSRPSSSEVERNTIAGCGWVSANTNHNHAGHDEQHLRFLDFSGRTKTAWSLEF